ncbi:MAG: PilZ domain-containing protein [Magnetococcales bacterium]|nr:PilZ domain-containing protein [Magnetococcales bacterium]
MNIFQRFTQQTEWSPARERRRAVRYPLQPLATLRLANGAVTQGWLKDVSTSGALLTVRELPFGLVEGEEGVLTFPFSPAEPDGDRSFSCVIPRVTRNGVAVRFIDGT